MLQMCRFVKPILAMVPPDPTTLNPKDLFKMIFLGRRFQGPERRRHATTRCS